MEVDEDAVMRCLRACARVGRRIIAFQPGLPTMTANPMSCRHMLVLFALPLLAYAAVCGLMYFNQRDFIYFPQLTHGDLATDFALERDGVTLRGWAVNPGQPDPILYFGGNAERVEGNRDDFAAWFPRRSVYLLAYRGYGASQGEPSEAALAGDAVALYDLVRSRHPGQRISLIGRSLGSGVAAHVAARRPVDRLALVTPFDSLAAAAQGHYPWLPVGWLMTDRYDSAALLASYPGPVLVLHAGRDAVVPAARTAALVEALAMPPEVVVFPRADHNDVHLQPGYGAALSAFLR